MIDEQLVLLETPSWTWSLFPNQSYLGRVQLTLRRQCDGSLARLTQEEWADLHLCLGTYERFLDTLFNPDRFNYEQLGNVWTQIHVHAIPRYSRSVIWQGITVDDSRWGDHPLPEPPTPLDEAATMQLAEKMRQELQNTSG